MFVGVENLQPLQKIFNPYRKSSTLTENLQPLQKIFNPYESLMSAKIA